ncbi:phosphotransferase, partial [filamentous cyanobacterium LEGE 11480]
PKSETRFLRQLQRYWEVEVPALCHSSQPMQAVHGDANFSNVLNSHQGYRWIDWEDTCIAPIEWDLACFSNRAQVFGEETTAVQAALTGYGMQTIDDRWHQLRTFQLLLWNIMLSQTDKTSWQRVAHRLQWLHDRHPKLSPI